MSNPGEGLEGEKVAAIGQEIARELGLPDEAPELGAFYVGLAVGTLLGQTSAKYPALPPSELKALAREALGRGAKGVLEAIRAHLDQPEGGPRH